MGKSVDKKNYWEGFTYITAEHDAVERMVYKVGHTGKDDDKRLRGFKTSHSRTIRTVKIFPSLGISDHIIRKRLEKMGHKKVKNEDAGMEFIHFNCRTELEIIDEVQIAVAKEAGISTEEYDKYFLSKMDDYNQRWNQSVDMFEELWYKLDHYSSERIFHKIENMNIAFPACACGEAIIALKNVVDRRDIKLNPDKLRAFGTPFEVMNTIYWLEKHAPELAGIKVEIIENDEYINRSEDVKMKFDIIISNPPFTPDNNPNVNKHKLWWKFLQKFFKTVKHDGYILMVSPNSWLSKSNTFKYIFEHEILYVDLTTKKYFPGVGSTFSSYIIRKRKVKNNKSVTYKSNGDIKQFNLDEFILPSEKYNNKYTLGIWEKMSEKKEKMGDFRHGTLGIHTNYIKHYSEKTGEYNAEVWNGKEIQYIKPINAYKVDKGKWKVCIRSVSNPTPSVTNIPTNQWAFIRYAKDENEAYNLLSILSSKLYYYFYSKAFWYSKGQIISVMRRFPDLNRNKRWTNEEIYKEFKLTQEEIEYIESIVTDIK